MNFKKLGNTELKVSTICLGTMTWGEQNSQKEAFEQMDYAVERGINFFDTAELYAIPPRKETYGKTEEIIGNWFKKKNNAFPKLVNPLIVPLASVTTDILKEKSAIIPVSKTPVAM